MTSLAVALDDYVVLRRSTGYTFRRPEKLLGQFVEFCDDLGTDVVTTEVALRWARLPKDASDYWVACRLDVVRGFSRHLVLLDSRTEVIPSDLVARPSSRAQPFLYTEDQVRALMEAAGSLHSPIRQVTFATIVGLLWATGMRVGEALSLDVSDVDLANGVLTVRSSKFGKSRELPLHDSTSGALRAYATSRSRLCPVVDTAAFFVSAAGTRMLYCNFHLGFQQLVRQAGIAARSPACRPRPHDLRHSFAVRTLMQSYRQGADVEAVLPRLSTYLGHVGPANTYWYLSAAPELLALAAERLEATTEARS